MGVLPMLHGMNADLNGAGAGFVEKLSRATTFKGKDAHFPTTSSSSE